MSSAADPTAAFFANLRGCGLLQQGQLQELWAWIAAARPDVQTVAKEISRRGWLTPFQIKEVFKGRGRGLTLAGRYLLLDLLGEGGMGRVYKARDTRMGKDVAVKVIRKDKLTHPAAAGRFKKEIEALGQMRHPNVVDVSDADLSGDVHFYVMELIDGTDLTKLVRDHGTVSVPDACDYIRQAALGLHHAYEKGLVHRDIKPSNIIVSRNGRLVKVVDLGLARLMENEDAAGGDGAGRITQEGFVIGTPDFLAPEQARNPMAVDIRADIYALGGTLYYILTGRVPYDGATPTEKLLKHCTDPPPSLLAVRPDIPPAVEQIVHWCMAKQPEARPQTPLQLALALQPFCPPATGAFAGAPSGRYPVTAAGTGPHAAMPAPPAGSGPMPAPPAGQPAYPYPPGYAYPAPPVGYPGAYPPGYGVPAPAPEPDPNRSSQVFKLPPAEAAADDPIRRRSEGGFPWGNVLLGLGALVVVGILGYGIYVQFIRGPEAPVEGFTNSHGMKMVRIDRGTFRMGSPESEPGRSAAEGPQHEVTIAGPFLMSAAEVSHTQFLRVYGSSPSKAAAAAHRAQNRPVESVTWDEANDFCKKLTDQENDKKHPWVRKGWAYRLPTEAEWEYAARAGGDGAFGANIGDGTRIIFETQGVFRPLDTDLYGIGGEPTKPPILANEVGKTDPNRWGLSDMHGNIAEWCSDWYKPGYPGGPRDNPTGPPDGDRRVVRGGSFKDPATATRAAARSSLRPGDRSDTVGFRVVYAPIQK